MKFKMHPRMFEATRLTREGRLSEATGLIQRLLSGASDPKSNATSALLTPASSIIELVPEKAETLAPQASSRASELEKDVPGAVRAKRGFLAKLTGKASQPKASLGALTNAKETLRRAKSDGQFLSASYSNNAGTRAYKLYVPSSYDGQQLPLIIMLHGCTQSARDFATGTGMNAIGEAKGCFIAYPEQSPSANATKCWNWFNPRDQQRDAGEPSLVAGITRKIIDNYEIDTKRVYVAGLSAGGAAAVTMGATYPELYAAVGVHSGLPAGSAVDLGSALTVMRNPKDPSGLPHAAILHGRGRLVPTIVFHGDKDTTVHPRNGHHVIDQSRTKVFGDLRSVSHHGHVQGGHSYTRTDHRDAAGRTVLEMWVIHGAGHAWSGGKLDGSYTDPRGPDASSEMVRFFLEHPALRK